MLYPVNFADYGVKNESIGNRLSHRLYYIFAFFLIVLLSENSLKAQIVFGDPIILESRDDPVYSVDAADLDGDKDPEILCTRYDDDLVVYFENTNGKGTFGSEQTIIDSAGGASSVCVVDVDGDNDNDVIWSGVFDWSGIGWLENTDGLGNFELRQFIDPCYPKFIRTADLDNDNDIDIISTGRCDDENVYWLENMDGKGTFDDPKVVTDYGEVSIDICICDLNGDGSKDILSTLYSISPTHSWIGWCPNTDGAGNFGITKIVGEWRNVAETTKYIDAADLDGDGDEDILWAGSVYSWEAATTLGIVSWYENLNGEGNFSSEQIITDNEGSVSDIIAIDLDRDGDNDVVTCHDDIVWYENTNGNGNFSEAQLVRDINFEMSVMKFIDLDGDGDRDILFGSLWRFGWIENLLYTSVKLSQDEFPEEFKLLQNYPNPFNPSTTIEFDVRQTTPVSLKVYDVLGREIKTLVNKTITPGKYKVQFNAEDLPSGIYIYRINMNEFIEAKKMIVLE